MNSRFPDTRLCFVGLIVERDPKTLRKFFDNYRDPLLAHACRDLRLTIEDAEDCISAFFADFTSHEKSFTYKPADGRFRTYLIGALQHRINTFHRDANTQKRGGGVDHLPIEEAPNIPDPAADELFVRDWALHVLARAKERMFAENDTKDARILYPYLTDPEPDYDSLGAQLGIGSSAVRKRLEVLHEKFRGHIRSEIRDTLLSPTDSEIDAELNLLRKYFFSCLPENFEIPFQKSIRTAQEEVNP